MNIQLVDFGLPAWWILPAVIVAVGLAYWLYTKPGVPWSRNQNFILGSLRFVVVFLILLLFLNPLIRSITNEVERPIVIIGVDNSSSVAAVHSEEQLKQITQQLEKLRETLEEDKDYRVELIPISGDSMQFDAPFTDLSNFFKQVENDYLGKNIAAVVLASDGIFNRGVSPAFRTFAFPVYSLGLGDTIPRKDVAIREVRHNSVAYKGNEFPFLVELTSAGYEGQPFEIEIKKDGNLLLSERGSLQSAGNTLTFFLSADQTGLQHYVVSVTQFDGEMTFTNNRYDVFIDVLESKRNVRIAGKSPHPDMRAIRTVLEETGNYQVFVDIPGMQVPTQERTFDIQILFDDTDPIGKKGGTWRILNDPTRDVLTKIPYLRVDVQGRPDKVIPSYNSQFTKFKLNRQTERLRRYPPISVPFGEYSLTGPTEILLYQQVGSVSTEKPLLAVFDDGNGRQAVLLGAGIWQWKLQEAAQFSDDFVFDELVQKLVQYLSIADDKQQFRVTNGREVFTDGDVVFFDVEIYDDIFQTLEGQSYSIEIVDENGQSRRFDFIFGAENKIARTITFASGTYRYKAYTTVGEKRLTASGEFVVNALQLEQRSLTANHTLLRLLAQQSNGMYAHAAAFPSLQNALTASQFQGIIRSDTRRVPFIKLMWVCLLIASLLSTEWILRKLWGAY
jgi:hypothetical protein